MSVNDSGLHNRLVFMLAHGLLLIATKSIKALSLLRVRAHQNNSSNNELVNYYSHKIHYASSLNAFITRSFIIFRSGLRSLVFTALKTIRRRK